MENSNGSTMDYSSEFEPMKKVKHLIESDEENDFKMGDLSDDVWVKQPKSERKPSLESTESKHYCGRLTVTTTQSDGTASSSEMSPGANNPSRSCTQCGATKTPLWRNGPCGPKSLCNACGIRYKKVGSTKRSFSSAATDPHDSTSGSGKSSSKSPKRKAEVEVSAVLERSHSRKSKVVMRDSSSSKRELEEKVSCNENENENENEVVFRQCPRVSVPRRVCTRRSLPAFNTPKWGSRSARFNSFRKSQSKDEEEGAALLMALACGLVNA